jgi:hypothetical protein
LSLNPGENPDKFESYKPGIYVSDGDVNFEEIIRLLIETVVKTDAGPIVNPGGFIDKIRAK